MMSFTAAVQEVDATGIPVVEAIAVELAKGAGPAAVEALLSSGGRTWMTEQTAAKWWVFTAAGPDTVSLGQAWDLVRELLDLPEVSKAEPLLFSRVPVASGAEAQRRFRLWGRVSDKRRAEIEEASMKPRQWSLVTLGVCDAQGEGGAWATWQAKHGEKELPGHGIVVAHPDTGYTRDERLLPHLLARDGDAPLHGWDFVEGRPDALDPLTRRVAHHPGHGTATASVIAAGRSDGEEPWGVAPGARVLPLRVSPSVIHLSFTRLVAALDRALEQKADVVSMSLGGPHASELLGDKVWELLDAGVIVVAAAGNNAPAVVFPARLPGVIACAASNAVGAPWRFSGFGSQVAVTAPGELVWHFDAGLDQGKPKYGVDQGSGTSYATAHVAGLAALWLSYHGRDQLITHCEGDRSLLPFLFLLCLKVSAKKGAPFLRKGKGGFGEGIAQADALLKRALPSVARVRKERQGRRDERADSLVDFPGRNWWTVLTLPTFAASGDVAAGDDVPEAGDRAVAFERFLGGPKGLIPGGLDDVDRAEIGAQVSADADLGGVLSCVTEQGGGVSAAAVRRYLLRKEERLSRALVAKLAAAQEASRKEWVRGHPELAEREATKNGKGGEATSYELLPPEVRRLRAFAFDPSLATRFEEVGSNEITIPVVFERELLPGPVGDYLEVVDVDPASDCAYAPVDLDHPYLLAQDGLPRSEGNPQFHQQMVYAVAMKTIGHFEEALGRPIFWSPLRPWDWRSGDDERAVIRKKRNSDRDDLTDQFVRRLRIYPHALREQNAYYSPQKRAILFGYFPAGDGDPGAELPGGVVFTCLAHDIVAHEVTHAILDGMHVHFVEKTNPDVLAFHEAFADLVALLQRFTYTDLVRDQIGRARGRLGSGTLMTRLGLQFGQTTGRGQALRDALGFALEQRRMKGDAEWREVAEEEEPGGGRQRTTLADSVRNLSDEERRQVWKRFEADPTLLDQVEEPHERGAFLVAAVFDAYIRIYEARVADLQRIATGGTGVLPDGELHPDLVARMAAEAAKAAGHVLRMCIRAMDYVPPLDITFGEFLRALITADSDLVPDDDRRYRVAFIEAFRKWGIYPRDVRTLSEESLRWSPPDGVVALRFKGRKSNALARARAALLDWQPGKSRERVFEEIRQSQGMLHDYFEKDMSPEARREILRGIDTERSFQVTNLRPARRIGPRGEFFTEMVVEVIQTRSSGTESRREVPFRGGVTLIVSLDDGKYEVRYAIYKRADSARRAARQDDFLLRAGGSGGGAAEYSSAGLPPGWFSDDELKGRWRAGRTGRLDDMRASSCACRRHSMVAAEAKKKAKNSGIGVREGGAEPFALLHRT